MSNGSASLSFISHTFSAHFHDLFCLFGIFSFQSLCYAYALSKLYLINFPRNRHDQPKHISPQCKKKGETVSSSFLSREEEAWHYYVYTFIVLFIFFFFLMLAGHYLFPPSNMIQVDKGSLLFCFFILFYIFLISFLRSIAFVSLSNEALKQSSTLPPNVIISSSV